jgi:hypothetical protein
VKLETTYVEKDSRARSLWFAILAFVGAPVGLALSAGIYRVSAVASIAAMVACVAAFIGGAFALARFNRPKTGFVEVTKRGVDFDGHTSIPRSKIKSAVFTPAVSGRPAHVRLANAHDAELGWIGVTGHEQGDEVLAALGLTAQQTKAEFFALMKAGSRTFWAFMAAILMTVGIAVGCAALFHDAAAGYLAILPFIVASVLLSPSKAIVGSDGILHQMRFDSRFFAWSDVESITPMERGIALLLRNGSRYEIATSSRGKANNEYARAGRAALLSRACDAWQAFHTGAVPDVSTRVARLGRSKEEWIASLKDREGSFRDAPIRSEDLWKLVESPAAEVTARAGAAAVLANEASEEDRVRLRVAADTCAEPRLRVVLDRAASGDDVMDAIGEVEDEAAQA